MTGKALGPNADDANLVMCLSHDHKKRLFDWIVHLTLLIIFF